MMDDGFAMDNADVEYSDARITAQLEFAQDQLSKLGSLVTELTERIDLILLPKDEALASINEVAKMSSDVVPVVTSPLSRVVDELNSTVMRLQKRVVAITERVQL